MNIIKSTLATLSSALILAASTLASAIEEDSVVGVGGYDLVSYQTSKKPLPGNGNHVVQHDGVNYLFSSKDNAKKFSKNMKECIPAYGGFCAYGASVGKKFIADPTVREVVDGQLYLNLDNSINSIWVKDIPGNIKNVAASKRLGSTERESAFCL